MYDYIFQYENKQLEIVTDTISEALEYLQFREPQLLFTHLKYFICMKTGAKTPVFNTRKIYIDNFQENVKV